MSVVSITGRGLEPVSPGFDLSPDAYRIRTDAEAIDIARTLATEFAREAAERDRDRKLPVAELDRFSGSGLWAVTIPKIYGGPGVSNVTLAEIIKIISAADPSIGQLPQNHFAAIDAIRASASEQQKQLWFERVLKGYRLGNAFSEAGGRHVGDFKTRFTRDGDSYLVKGEKFYATGALFAHFIHIGAVDDNDKVNLAIAPRDAPGLTIIDDWSGFGQRTTASGKVLIDNVRLGAEAIIPAYLGAENPSSNGSISQLIQAAVDAGIARGAIEETISFVRNHARPWLDSGQEHGYEDVFTISQIGDLEVRLHAAEALLARAGAPLMPFSKTQRGTPWRQRPPRWPRRKSLPPRLRSWRPTSFTNWAERARRWQNTILIATGATRALTRSTIRYDGNISMLEIMR